jgi:hypothetical protein
VSIASDFSWLRERKRENDEKDEAKSRAGNEANPVRVRYQ